jgi:large subunit ribosomal protein L35
MPKLKTHRGAAKRFSITAGGKVKINHAKRRHILTKKTTKHKRGLRKAYMASPANAPTVKRLLPYAK